MLHHSLRIKAHNATYISYHTYSVVLFNSQAYTRYTAPAVESGQLKSNINSMPRANKPSVAIVGLSIYLWHQHYIDSCCIFVGYPWNMWKIQLNNYC